MSRTDGETFGHAFIPYLMTDFRIIELFAY